MSSSCSFGCAHAFAPRWCMFPCDIIMWCVECVLCQANMVSEWCLVCVELGYSLFPSCIHSECVCACAFVSLDRTVRLLTLAHSSCAEIVQSAHQKISRGDLITFGWEGALQLALISTHTFWSKIIVNASVTGCVCHWKRRVHFKNMHGLTANFSLWLEGNKMYIFFYIMHP